MRVVVAVVVVASLLATGCATARNGFDGGPRSLVAVAGPKAELAPLKVTPDHELAPAISADGNRLLFEVHGASDGCCDEPRIAVLAVAQPTLFAFLTPEGDVATRPTWGAREKAIFYVELLPHPSHVMMRALDPNAEPLRLDIGPSPHVVAFVRDVALSPDGSLIACAYAPKSRYGSRFRMVPEEDPRDTFVTIAPRANPKEISLLVAGREPAFSPDGRSIAYVATIDGREKLLVTDTTSLGPRQLTFGDSDDRSPTWSPDGRFVAYACHVHEGLDGDESSELCVVAANGGRAHVLTRGDGTIDHPTWSRDGFVYFAADSLGTFDLFRMRTPY